jgi:hypothetical protein
MSEPAGASPVIAIDHLTKYYGDREIISDLSLQVPRGSPKPDGLSRSRGEPRSSTTKPRP